MSGEVNDKPRCRMCVRPAWWRTSANGEQGWSSYCTSGACNNPDRICQKCDAIFRAREQGASSKYCRTCTTGSRFDKSSRKICEWCGAPGRGGPHPLNSFWPFICSPCLEPIKHVAHQFKRHHLTPEIAKKLIQSPLCSICERDVLSPVLDPRTGKKRALLRIDHDHSCCPGEVSCGKCVRGPLCGSCNLALGLLGDSSDGITKALKYLENQPWKAS